MRIAEVVGNVTLSSCHPSFQGACLKLALPFSLAELAEGTPGRLDSVVVWDEYGAGSGSRIALSEGPEAAQPFRPDIKPVDAYNAAILDEIELGDEVKTLIE